MDASDAVWEHIDPEWMQYCIVYNSKPPSRRRRLLNWLLRRKHNPTILFVDGRRTR